MGQILSCNFFSSLNNNMDSTGHGLYKVMNVPLIFTHSHSRKMHSSLKLRECCSRGFARLLFKAALQILDWVQIWGFCKSIQMWQCSSFYSATVWVRWTRMLLSRRRGSKRFHLSLRYRANGSTWLSKSSILESWLKFELISANNLSWI